MSTEADGAAGDDIAAGTEIGPYRVVGVIGRGGMGVVLEARHTRVNQRVALKVLAPTRRGALGPTAVRRFLTEVEALSRLEHPGLVRVLDRGESPEHGPWIAMEFVAGDMLRVRLEDARERPLSLAAALRTIRQIAAAVARIHAAGIVHRDLKPENIMVTPDDEAAGGERVKLLDFGIAKLIADDDGHTTEGTVVGTAGYMAPEQCTGTSEIDDRVDVYALGVIAFELLTGTRPFTGTNVQVMHQHLMAEPPLDRLPPSLPALLIELVRAMLAKERSRRPAAVDVARRVRALEAGGGAPEVDPDLAFGETLPAPGNAGSSGNVTTLGSAASIVVPPVSSPPRRRRWPWLVASGAAVVALAAVIGARAWRRGSPQAPTVAEVLPGMVRIEGARFRLGSTDDELTRACAELPGGCVEEELPQLRRELPAHEVTVSRFDIDAFEVTNRDFAKFLEVRRPDIEVRPDKDDHYPRFVDEIETHLTLVDMYASLTGLARGADGAWIARAGMADQPVQLVTWDGASRYCRHHGKRLPTEAEWELAAAGRQHRRFPWGAEAPRCDGVVFGRGDARGCPDLPIELAPVGTSTQDVTVDGVHDLGGNVGEWVQDSFIASYRPCDGCRDPITKEDVALADDFRIFRGGTLGTPAWSSRTTTRGRWRRTAGGRGIGFRCVTR